MVDISEKGVFQVTQERLLSSALDSGKRMTSPLNNLTAAAVFLGDEGKIAFITGCKISGRVSKLGLLDGMRWRIVINTVPSLATTPTEKYKTCNQATEEQISNELYNDTVKIYTSSWKPFSEFIVDPNEVPVEKSVHARLNQSFKVPPKLQKGPGSPFNSMIDKTGQTEYLDAWVWIEIDNPTLATKEVSISCILEVFYKVEPATIQKLNW